MLNQNFWDKYLTGYDVLNHSLSYQELLKTVLKELGVKQGMRVLDVGSGTGNLAVKIKDMGADCVGIDFSRVAHKLHLEKDPHAKILYANLIAPLPFKDESFDAVCSINTLYNFNQEQRMSIMREFFRVTAGGGTVVIVNLKNGYSPYEVWINHVHKNIRLEGFLNTLVQHTKLLPTILRCFYHNKRIQRHYNYKFFRAGEQVELLTKAGFVPTGPERPVCGGQMLLASSVKAV